MLAHFSIRTKVLGLVGSIVLLCAGFSFYLLGQLRQVDDGYSRLIDREVTFALKAERARGDLANMGRQFNNVLLLQNPAGLPPLVQSIAGITARVSENLEVAARLAPTAYASRLAEARAAAGRVAEVAERIYALKRSGDHAGAAALYGSEGRPVVVGTFDQLARIADDINGEVAVRSDALTGQMEGTSAVGLTLLAVLALGSLGGGLLISAFGVTRPLRQLSDRMAALAAGDTTAEVPGLRRGDELGVMAQLLARFRDSLAEAERQRSGQQAAELQRQQEKLRDTVAVAEGVERSLGDVVLGLRGAAETLANSTGGLSRITDATLQQAQSAAAGASETSANVQTVAAAAEQLAASVAEIARQVTQSNTVVGRAAEDARRTDTTVRALSEGADRIGEVVRMISDIAGQTNLLALNATIEAARAGDAGKGFAVVAGEVKALATQTATATQEIARQVGAMQAATLQAVEAIRGITSTIDEVNQISSAIAVAVEQQGSATREIARNVQQAAQGTAEMSANVQRMNDSAVNSQSGLVQVNAAARDVSRQGDTLRSELTSLVQRLRAV